MGLINEGKGKKKEKKHKQESTRKKTCINKEQWSKKELINEREGKKEKKKEKERTIPIANTKEKEKDVERASRRKGKAFRAKALYATPNHFNRLKRGIAIIDSDLGLGDDIHQSIHHMLSFLLLPVRPCFRATRCKSKGHDDDGQTRKLGMNLSGS